MQTILHSLQVSKGLLFRTRFISFLYVVFRPVPLYFPTDHIIMVPLGSISYYNVPFTSLRGQSAYSMLHSHSCEEGDKLRCPCTYAPSSLTRFDLALRHVYESTCTLCTVWSLFQENTLPETDIQTRCPKMCHSVQVLSRPRVSPDKLC